MSNNTTTLLGNPTAAGMKAWKIMQSVHYRFTVSCNYVDPPMEIEFYVGGVTNQPDAMALVESIGFPLSSQMEKQVKEARAAGKTVAIYCDTQWWALHHVTHLELKENVNTMHKTGEA